MASLQEIVQAVRKEVDQAFASENNPPSQRVLEPDRVVITVHFSVANAGEASQALVFSTGKPEEIGNSLTIECRYRSGESTEPTLKAEGPRVTPELAGTEAERVIQQLSKVFGAPGFDSAARATVFREALDDLATEDTAALIATLSRGTSEPAVPVVKRSIGLIQRVCQAGPAGSAAGVKILAEVLSEHDPRLVSMLVANVWKTQEEWLS